MLKEMKNDLVADGSFAASIFRKFFLIREFKKKGFEGAMQYKNEEDCEFLQSLLSEDVSTVRHLLEQQLATIK